MLNVHDGVTCIQTHYCFNGAGREDLLQDLQGVAEKMRCQILDTLEQLESGRWLRGDPEKAEIELRELLLIGTEAIGDIYLLPIATIKDLVRRRVLTDDHTLALRAPSVGH